MSPLEATEETTDWFLVRCPECGGVQEFTTEQACDAWLKHHAHDSEVG